MYGKLFQRMYQGSMVGSGANVFAVWGYCIANADPESHCVDLNPVLLSAVLGESVESITSAIQYLASPDPNSHNKDYEGRRIIPTTGFEYFLTSHEIYRNMTNNEDMRAYFREQKRKQRASKDNVLDSLGQSQDSASVSVSDSGAIKDAFERCWKAYPDKSGSKHKAFQAYKQANAVEADVLAGIERYKKYVDIRRKDGFKDLKYANGQTWFNQRRWEAEYECVKSVSDDEAALIKRRMCI